MSTIGAVQGSPKSDHSTPNPTLLRDNDHSRRGVSSALDPRAPVRATPLFLGSSSILEAVLCEHPEYSGSIPVGKNPKL
jgi:hypothetical protein